MGARQEIRHLARFQHLACKILFILVVVMRLFLGARIYWKINILVNVVGESWQALLELQSTLASGESLMFCVPLIESTKKVRTAFYNVLLSARVNNLLLLSGNASDG